MDLTFDVLAGLKGEELTAVICGDAVEGSAFLNCLIQNVEMLQQEDGIGLFVIDLHMREEHLQGVLIGDLRVLTLEGVY